MRRRLGSVSRHLSGGSALLVALPFLALPVRAQVFSPGSGVCVSAGGPAQGGDFQAACSIGQPVLGVATSNSWAFWAGIVTSLAPSVVIEIAPLDPTPATAGAPATIEFDLNANRPVASALLHYRQGGQTAYSSLAMTARTERTWTANIPGSSVTLRGIEYYLEVEAAGRTAYSPTSSPHVSPHRLPVRVTGSDGGGSLATVEHRYRMISIPAVLTDSLPRDVMVDDLGQPDSTAWRCGRWDPAAELSREVGVDNTVSFAPGRAFWLITDQPRRVTFGGATVFPPGIRDHAITLTLKPGWNQIGNPFAYEVGLAHVLVDDGSRVRSLAEAVTAGLVEPQPLHAYDGTTYHAEGTSLAPWTGYFVANLNDTDIDLVLPALESPAGVASRPLPDSGREPPAWLMTLRAQDTRSVATVEIGGAANAEEAWDSWDRLQPPAAPQGGVALRVQNPALPPRTQALQRDVRPLAVSGGAVWIVQAVVSEAGVVKLSWTVPADFPSGCAARLVDLQRHSWIDLAPDGAYETAFAGPGTASFRVAIGAPGWLDLQSPASGPAGAHFTAALMGGNPTRGVMQARLMLERAERIAVCAFDLHGRLVRTIKDEQMGPGVHIISWDGMTAEGRTAPSGMYILRVAGGGRERTLRGVLLR